MKSLSQVILEKEQSKKQKKYDDFFEGKLKEYGVKSPAELDDAKKKEFFNEIDKEWDGESTNEMALPVKKDLGADVKDEIDTDIENQENGGGSGEEIDKKMGDGDKSSDKIEDDGNKMGEPKNGGDGEAIVADEQDLKTGVIKEENCDDDDEDDDDDDDDEEKKMDEAFNELVSGLTNEKLTILRDKLNSLIESSL